MSHDNGHSKENKTIISFKNSFWLVIIIVGLFIAALNFISSENGGEDVSPGRPKVEEAAAPANEKPAGEIRAEVRSEKNAPSETVAPAADTTKAK